MLASQNCQDRLFSYGLGLAPGLNLHFHRFLPLDEKAGYYHPETGRGTDKLFDEVLHVPLVIRFPLRMGVTPGRWSGIVELREVFATVCEVLTVEACMRPGEGLLHRLREGLPEDGVAYSVSSGPNPTRLPSRAS